ncbi:MAG: hypothetical protein JSW17_04140 [Candidatus Omnitrophota bacterium]|nr:MAG: hypothetical protein JSW17_04140 [Candidatus Omnitrophota bacterium]
MFTKRAAKIIVIVLVLNAITLFFNIKEGIEEGDMMLRFHEREAVTFLSALMLGLSSMTSLAMYLLSKKANILDKGYRFWGLVSIGFFYLCMDEYFMAHEGMDEAIGSLFGQNIKHLNLDNLVLAFFGLVALSVCFYFRKELIKHKNILLFLFLGAFGLLGTVIFHALERIDIVYEVIEESFKLVGVSFFFAGFLSVLTTFIKKLSVSSPDNL